MRHYESTKKLVTVGNSIGVMAGREASLMNKHLQDRIGVMFFDSEMIVDVCFFSFL